MKKTALARMQQVAQELEQVNDSSLNRLVEILESSFSAIATAEPKIALQIIAQLNEQAESIKSIAQERRENADRYVKGLAAQMPDFINLEDGDEDEETDPSEMN